MKDYYSKYTNEYSWIIKEEGWVRALQGVRETQLAIGNGFLGSRAVLEEIPYDAKPGTYIAGLYDSVGSKVSELVNLPNPFNFKITAHGEKMGVITMDVIEHRRILNLRHGVICRHSVFQDTNKKRYDYQSIRFLSAQNKNIGVMQVIFTALDSAADISVQTGIDTSVYNAGTVTEGRKKHFRVKELGQFKNEGYLIVDTFDKMHTVIFRSGFYYETGGKKIPAKDNVLELRLKKNQTIIFTKIFFINRTPKRENLNKLKKISEKKFRKAFRSSFRQLLKRHIDSWEELWDLAEVSIWGDPEAEKKLRFNIYHLLIAAPENSGFSSIGAKALTGEGYRGHIFWDTEIFILPFYIYTIPEKAKNILLYRYKRLDAAKELARKNGFKGAMFPWESAASGSEETPDRAKDLDGKVIKIYTGQREHHISADIAYAFFHYYNVTNDEKFFRDYGYEVVFETARFWASRVEYNKKKGKYEINGVIGPDEFHDDVNNNAFTNTMAKWNLLMAHNLYQKIKRTKSPGFKNLKEKVTLSDKEAKNWKKIAGGININMNKKKIIEQFDGYFRKREIKITAWDENFLPVISQKLTPRDYNKTQLVKQADVIMLLYLFPDAFPAKIKKANYAYYLDRTLHKSSLSLPSHASMAIEVGDKNRAYSFFNTALRADISNVNNNTSDGIHAACIGGTWQVLVNGFAGVRIHKGILAIDPKLPSMWRKVIFSMRWRGYLLRLEIKNDKIKIYATPSNGENEKFKIRLFGVLYGLRSNKLFNIKRKAKAASQEAHYL